MKNLLTATILILVASNACAQVYSNGVQTVGHNPNIVYNVSPLPPVMQGNQITYPSGTAFVANSGGAAACDSPLTIDKSSGYTRIICHSSATQQPANTNAANLANLAPAAGGRLSLSDRNLAADDNLVTDNASALRNDRNVVRVQ